MEHEPQNLATDPAPSLEPAPTPPPAYSAEPAAVPPAAVTRRSRGMRLLNVALVGAVALAIAGVSFAAGRLTAPAGVAAGNVPGGGPGGQFFQGKDGQGTQNGRPTGPGAAFDGGPTIEGTVESVTETTLTLKTASGQTIQIALDGTTYHAQTDASADDVTAGGKVLVRLNLRDGNGSGGVTNPSASDVTVVP